MFKYYFASKPKSEREIKKVTQNYVNRLLIAAGVASWLAGAGAGSITDFICRAATTFNKI